jgi:hypothetical protein
MVDLDTDALLTKGTSTWNLAKKAMNQWLDAPEDLTPRPLFIVGCQRSGTTMLIQTLMRAPDVWVHPEKSQLAYNDYRLRSPATIEAITRMTPASTVVYKPLCDAHLTDRILAAHPGGRAWWLYRGWRDVANSAVRKWGTHQRQVVLDIAAGHGDRWGWRGERLPEALIDQLAGLVTPEMTPEAGAALFWYIRNSFFHSLGLDTHPEVSLIRYETLVSSPQDSFGPLFRDLDLDLNPSWIDDIVSTSIMKSDMVDPSPDIVAVCDALEAKLDSCQA